MEAVEVRATNGEATLAGSVWTPSAKPPRGLVLMHPGSGPSDRHNDVLFPPIRDVLLDVGVAVCSFDKRGVGESGGSWFDAGIEDQAADLAASLREARAVVPAGPCGLFGHSQGGWVVLEAAGRTGADFVITNSGPAVSPRLQEAFSTGNRLGELGWDEDDVHAGTEAMDQLMDLLGSGSTFTDAQEWIATPGRSELIARLTDAGAFVPDSAGLWSLSGAILDHDPEEALKNLRVPLLALLGAADTAVPVERSAELYRAFVRPDLLDLQIMPGADHRMMTANGDAFVSGYLSTISSFVTGRL